MIGWTIYERPKDFPTQYVARKWESNAAGDVIASHDEFFAHTNLAKVRRYIQKKMEGKTHRRFPRSPDDDAVILETWL